jgi:hypothetical protein
MAPRSQTKVTRTTTRTGNVVPEEASTTRTTSSVEEEASPPRSVVAVRIVYYILGVIEVILAFRFVLALLGANRANDFAQFVFNLSLPFVQPFFGLFKYEPTYGSSQFEIYTLVAMAVYAVVAWGIASLIRLPRGTDEDAE